MLKPVLENQLARTALSTGLRQTANELRALVDVFLEALEGQAPQDVTEAFVAHRKESPFMPKPSEILAKAKDIVDRRRARVRRLPPPTDIHEDQRRANLEGIRRVRDALAKRKAVRT